MTIFVDECHVVEIWTKGRSKCYQKYSRYVSKKRIDIANDKQLRVL